MNRPTAVLDTNVVLDWLVFREPGCAPLVAAIEQGRVRWIASAWMHDEFRHVARHRLGERWLTDANRIDAAWQRCSMVAAPMVGAAQRLRCTDPQDQPFIDLALASGARWLVSRDRALLKLARRAGRHGLSVVPPQRWVE